MKVTTCGDRLEELDVVPVTEGVGVGSTDGFGVSLVGTFTPLFQTNFFPDFIQVYLMPFTVEVDFSFGQVSPALTAALAIFVFNGRSKIAKQRTDRNAFALLMG